MGHRTAMLPNDNDAYWPHTAGAIYRFSQEVSDKHTLFNFIFHLTVLFYGIFFLQFIKWQRNQGKQLSWTYVYEAFSSQTTFGGLSCLSSEVCFQFSYLF